MFEIMNMITIEGTGRMKTKHKNEWSTKPEPCPKCHAKCHWCDCDCEIKC